MGRRVNILAIETATTSCAVGVRTREGREITRVVDEQRHHTETLTLAMATLLDECALVPRDVECVVVDRGPGLYTGLRVGVATALAFARALGVGVVGVTSLELLARGAYEAGARGTLVSVVDARRGEIFVQRFHLREDDEEFVVATGEPTVTRARDVVIEWATNGQPVTFTGDGVERYATDFHAVPNALVVPQMVPSLRAALDLGIGAPSESRVTPLYLREADAVANFTTRDATT